VDLKKLSSLLLTFLALDTNADEFFQKTFQIEKKYIYFERLNSICAMAKQVPNYSSFSFSEKEIRKLWQPPQNCAEIETALQKTINQLSPDIKSDYNSYYPLYSTMLTERMTPNKELLTPFHNPEANSTNSSPHIVNPWTLEAELRKLHQNKKSNCTSTTEEIEDNVNIYDNNFWHQLFIQQGYDCTISLYKKQVLRLNGKKQRLQSVYESSVKESETYDLFNKNQTKSLKKLKDTIVVYLPNLGYDIPPANINDVLKYFIGKPPKPEVRNEILAYQELKSFFNKNHVPFYVLKRTSLSSVDNQVNQTLKNLRSVIAKEGLFNPYSKKKILVLTRSMGGLIARLTLKKDPSVNKYIKGVILIGSTPHGSVIADYKSRGDINFFTITTRVKANFLNNTLANIIPVLKAGLYRADLETMSHTNFQPLFDTDPLHNYPIINLIFLREHAANYFETLGKKVADVDLTFLNMLTYGPTEGSSPLTHAAWDTPNSVRIIDTRLNHLGFWTLNSNQGLQIYEAILNVLEQW
jgi:hypothetical protein